ncbi:uncharacterized protein [Amphiura filiformis]|uniref:uncharacterized protein n=1 Tax=Amphiura filiformis TaxID=82378 RepID=UPI003B211627
MMPRPAKQEKHKNWKRPIRSEQKLRSNFIHLRRVNQVNISALNKEQSFVISTIKQQQKEYIKDLKSLQDGQLTVPVADLCEDDNRRTQKKCAMSRRMSLPVMPSEITKRLGSLQISQESNELTKNREKSNDGSEDEDDESIVPTVGAWGDFGEHDSSSVPSVGGGSGGMDEKHRSGDSAEKFHPEVSISSFSKHANEAEVSIDPMEEEILQNIRRNGTTNTRLARETSDRVTTPSHQQRRMSLPDDKVMKRLQAYRPGRSLLQRSMEYFEDKPIEAEVVKIEKVKIPNQRPNTPIGAVHHEHHAKCFHNLPPGERPLCMTSRAEICRKQRKFRAKMSPRAAFLNLNLKVNNSATQRPLTSFGANSVPAYRMPTLIPDESANKNILQTLKKVSMTPTLTKEEGQKTLLYLSKVNQNRQNNMIMSKLDDFLKRNGRKDDVII